MSSHEQVTRIKTAVDFQWQIIATVMIIIMQVGFGMLEAGTVQRKNSRNILVKNILDMCISALSFWLVGYAVAFGCDDVSGLQDCNRVIGDDMYALHGAEDSLYADWLFQFAFASTSVTIVSGSVCERMDLRAYMVSTLWLVVFVYPMVVRTVWGPGLLAEDRSPVIDFAGAGVVHMCGGMAGLVGAIILGPRNGRFEGPRGAKTIAHEFPPYSSTFVALGTLLLWTGWYGFNAGSVSSFTDQQDVVHRVLVCTTMSPVASVVTTTFMSLCFKQKIVLSQILNSALTGLVAITAGANVIFPEWSFLVGCISSLVYLLFSRIFKMLHIDDPLDASPVHFCGGLWGILAVGLFADEGAVREIYNQDEAGLFTTGHFGLLGWQLAFGLIVATWTTATVGPLFWIMSNLGVLRVPLSVETHGLDLEFHGGSDENEAMLEQLISRMREEGISPGEGLSQGENKQLEDVIRRLVHLASA